MIKELNIDTNNREYFKNAIEGFTEKELEMKVGIEKVVRLGTRINKQIKK